ncbi:Malectin/receptor-like protein kinase family protein [Euphorbia peplus]|nr:Malectin/receptor-like protein kinase family protein [Euphorbia peplus]
MNHLYMFFLFFFIHQTTLVFCSYNATDSMLLNCGSSESSATPDGRNWIPELRSKFGPVNDGSTNKSISSDAVNQASSAPSVPYMTARISRSSFTYNFPVTSGQKIVRLYFYPSNYMGGFERNKDWFDVRVGAYTFLGNFSASLYSDSMGETFFKEYCIHVGDEQSLNITFSPFSNDSYVFINGIEIVSMPANLYHTPPDDDQGIKFVGENRTSRIQNHTVLQNVCRLNVGGGFITPEDDTGIYRSWDDDFPYFMSMLNNVTSNSGANLNYSKIQQFAAPADVYLSSRFMGLKSMDNLTWNVLVYPGYTYLIRLHFCEFFTGEKVNDRRFDVFIDNKNAETGLDIVELTGGSLIPIYKDYLVNAGNKGELEDYTLALTIRPNPKSLYPTPFLNGMEVLRLNDSDGNLSGPNPEPSISPEPAIPPVQPSPGPDKSNTNKTLLIASIGGSVIGLLVILFVSCLVLKKFRTSKGKKDASYSQLLSCCGHLSSKKGQSVRSKASSLPQELCRNFSLHEIKAATKNFDGNLIIGEGGFGNVYKGEIDDTTTLVAIKRLNQDSKQGTKEFMTEIEMLSQLRHVHLVPLIGYCTDEGEMILVYDYMINGTLREHLYDNINDPLSWKQRLEICIGAARGLDYLHTGAAHTIIHRDIKTTNILLDGNLIAKVSDFGLSRICVNNTAVSTLVKGTWGYLDPEYARRNQLTEKSDVYSFGVVLFEVLCARKPLNNKLDEAQRNLAIWARKCIENETIYEIIDPFLMGKISSDCFNKFVEIAESCIRDNGSERPSMHDVKEKLEFTLELQKAADAEKKGDDDPVYPEVSFCAPRYNNSVFGSSDSSRVELSMTCSGVTSTQYCFESDTITSSDSAFSSDVTKTAPA